MAELQRFNMDKTMSELIWKLYNENMISEEVAHILLDKLYDRVNNKKY